MGEILQVEIDSLTIDPLIHLTDSFHWFIEQLEIFNQSMNQFGQ